MADLVWSKTWRKPKVTFYVAAPPSRWHIIRNRYGNTDGSSVTIGMAFRAGSRVLSIVWAQPKAIRAQS